MNISELTHERLRIALNAIEKDPAVGLSTKAGFKTIYECLYEQKLCTEIIESELLQKASSSQLAYSISQKLSVSQFLSYFHKMEKIISGIHENLESKIESKIEQALNQKYKSLDEQLQQYLSQQQQYQQQLTRKHKQEVERLIQESNNKLTKKICALVNENKENELRIVNIGKANHNSNSLQNQQLIEELKTIQEYCEDNKRNLDDMVIQIGKLKSMHDVQASTSNFVSFNDLRSIMSNLEDNLNSSIGQFMAQGRGIQYEWKCYGRQKCLEFKSAQKMSTIGVLDGDKVRICEGGIYQIICGFFPTEKTSMRISVNKGELASHTCTDPPRNSMARTIMFYVRLDAESLLSLHCQSNETVTGFLLINNL